MSKGFSESRGECRKPECHPFPGQRRDSASWSTLSEWPQSDEKCEQITWVTFYLFTFQFSLLLFLKHPSLTLCPRITSCLSFLCVGITGMRDYAWLKCSLWNNSYSGQLLCFVVESLLESSSRETLLRARNNLSLSLFPKGWILAFVYLHLQRQGFSEEELWGWVLRLWAQ